MEYIFYRMDTTEKKALCTRSLPEKSLTPYQPYLSMCLDLSTKLVASIFKKKLVQV